LSRVAGEQLLVKIVQPSYPARTLLPCGIGAAMAIVKLIMRSSRLSAISGSCMLADGTEEPEGGCEKNSWGCIRRTGLTLEEVNHVKGTERI
jgi:hypothetical protein